MNELSLFIQSHLANLRYSPETNAYLIRTLSMLDVTHDLSKDILILKYAEAKQNYNFIQFQTLGDWILFIRAIFPTHFDESPDYINAIAQNSYYFCYRILNRQWKVFEELADRFPDIVQDLRLCFIELEKKPAF